jgi:outer membrane protein assembly factor BamD
MTRPPYAHAAALLLGIAPFFMLAGCAQNRNKADTQYVARDVSTLYNAARQRLADGRYELAAALFDEVERQHPYSPWARRAQLMSAFSYYGAKEYTESIKSAQRFLSIHPGNRDAPYAYYLMALCYYEQIGDVTRDQKITNQAHDALSELIRRYPDSRYAADARLKLDLVNDHLAGKEMEVGRFYERRRQWIAASLRFRKVIDTYQSTTHTPEALQRLTETYLALGLREEAMRSAAVLGTNYPGTVWYERAFTLVREHAPAEFATAQAAARAGPPVPTRPPLPPGPSAALIAAALEPAPVAVNATAKVDGKATEKAAKKAAKAQKKADKAAREAAEEAARGNCRPGGLFHRRRCEPTS